MIKLDLERIKVSEGNDSCSRCGGDLGKQKAVVAFSACSRQAVIVTGTKHLLCDFREGGIDAGDIWPGEDEPDSGVWVWEGNINYNKTPDTPNAPGEWDVDYDGDFRKPTSEEWLAVQSEKDPWT